MCDLHDLCQKVVEYRKKNDIYNMEKLIDEIEKDYADEVEFRILKVKVLTDKFLFDEAIKELENIIKESPDSYEAYFVKGKIEISRGQVKEAYEDFLVARRLEPKNNEIREYIARALIDLRRFEEARDILKTVYRYSKTDKNIGYFESCNQYIIEQLEEKDILNDFEKISLAKSYYSLGKNEQALEIIESVKDIDSNVEALFTYFNIINYFKDYKKAEEIIDKAIELGEDKSRCYLYKGIALEHNLKYEEAEDTFRKLIEMDKDFEPAYNRLARILNKIGKYNESIEISNIALKNNFDKEVTYNNIGISNYYLQNFDDAIRAYNKAISIYPAYLDSYLNKSRLYRDGERYREAMDCCNEAMDLGHKNEKIALEKAYILNCVDEVDRAIEWLDWAIDMEGNDIRLYCLKGICLCKLERYGEAIQEMEQVARLSGEEIMAHSALLHVYYQMGNIIKAKEIFFKYKDFLSEMSKSHSILRDDNIYFILRNTAISFKQKLREEK
ncbi:MAG: tetratricopeptide repeat protein [Clostridium sp.]|nr:tetratricopeptide repeat protein [Clostridium sp.]